MMQVNKTLNFAVIKVVWTKSS